MSLRKVVIALSLLAGVPVALADSAGSKNKNGNRLFEQGKYEEAQKAYQEAQIQKPDRPEPLYNAGNALIKQKKYDQALQQLNQAISKADKGLQSWGWYNAGNALYEMGQFRDSASAYIQSLKLNPADRDAKYNLELALKKLQEQQQQQSRQNQKNDEQGKEVPDQGKGPKPPPQSGDQDNQEDPNKPVQPKSTRGEQGDAQFSKERALQILDALENQELAEQRKLMKQSARRKVAGRDW
jgi:Ca-activated chloride channel family protein